MVEAPRYVIYSNTYPAISLDINEKMRIVRFLQAFSCDISRFFHNASIWNQSRFPNTQCLCPAASWGYMPHSHSTLDDRYLLAFEAVSRQSSYQVSKCSSFLNSQSSYEIKLNTIQTFCTQNYLDTSLNK